MSEPTITDEELAELEWEYGTGLYPGVLRLIAALRAERAEVEELRKERRFAFKQVDDLAAEVERLRAELDGLVAQVTEHAPTLLYRIDL